MALLASTARLIWEMPQSALGAAALALSRVSGDALEISRDEGRVFVRSRSVGVSLGHFVFYTEEEVRWFRRDPLMKRHEHGHTFQSRRLGPLYLPLVGVPSVMRLLYAIGYRELTGKRWRRYYDGYPERQADRLGGITAEERAAQLASEP